MANINCQEAFNQEMAVLGEISDNLKKIFDKISSDAPSAPQPVPSSLETKIDETNRLLKLLCVGILGKDK